SVDAGTGSWWAKKTQQSHGSAGSYAKWQITATAKSPDGRVSRTVQESARALPPIQSILPLLNYALYVGGCSQNCPPFNVNNLCKNGDITDNTSVGGSFTATGNFWVGNSLCLSGGAK